MNHRTISRALFVVTTVLGSFLMFQAEPLFSKYLLPAFGGSASVWTSAVFVFQALLLIGYAYAYVLTRQRVTVQIVSHILVLMVAGTVSLILSHGWPSLITPPLPDAASLSAMPQFHLTKLLLIGLGLPFFILSTTSTLLQYWAGKAHTMHRPYLLYSLSNAGSLMAIVWYPVLTEPFLSLQEQGLTWAVLYGIYTLAFVAGGLCTLPSVRREHHVRSSPSAVPILPIRSYTFWLLLSMLSTVLLLSATNQINESIATVPFLWLLPLGLYLLSFVISFSGSYTYARNVYSYIGLLFVFFTLLMFTHIYAADFGSEILVMSIMLFSAFMVIHGALYERRPAADHMPSYYVMISLGGVLGSFAVTFLAPALFTQHWEFYVSMYICAYLAYTSLIYSDESFLATALTVILQSKRRAYIWGMILMTLIFGSYTYLLYTLQSRATLMSTRTFYGRIRVAAYDGIRYLYHGNIIHGTQYIAPAKRSMPTTYYTENSGVGIAIRYNSRRLADDKTGMRVGVIGLGTGTIAAFGRKGDAYEFYEINPAVVQVAKKYFTYLSDSPARISIFEGDGRLSLAQRVHSPSFNTYDVLALDAFSDDAIPLHLLTKEAFELYFTSVDPVHGIIAVHISNRHIDLKPQLVRISKQFGVRFLTVVARKDAKEKRGVQSEWVLLTNDNAFAKNTYVQNSIEKEKTSIKKIPMWTDDYSNILWSLK